MSKSEIIAELRRLSPQDRAEILDHLLGLEEAGGPTPTERALLDEAQADYDANPTAGLLWMKLSVGFGRGHEASALSVVGRRGSAQPIEEVSFLVRRRAESEGLGALRSVGPLARPGGGTGRGRPGSLGGAFSRRSTVRDDRAILNLKPETEPAEARPAEGDWRG